MIAVLGLAAIGGAYFATRPAAVQAPLAIYATGDLADLRFDRAGERPPETPLIAVDGREARLGDFTGQVVLANLWASWCAPCIRELPSLERLRREIDRDDFTVLAISLDRGGKRMALETLDKAGVTDLEIYLEPTNRLGLELGEHGLPVTLLLDREGRELGRFLGVADWAGPEARALIEAVLASS